MNTPNKLTTLRMIMVPFFVFFLLADMGRTGDIIALILFCLASFTDFLDGYLARKNHQITNFGKFMDPLADKLLVGSAAICLIALDRIPAWVVVILIGREFIISGFRLVASDNGVVIAASMWGKAKTVCQMIMTIVLILHFEGTVWGILEQVLIALATILTIVSLLDYVYKNRKVLDGPI